MKSMTFLPTLVTVLILSQTTAFSLKNRHNNEVFPLMIEYIPSYKLKVNDLRDVIANQFSNITISPIKTSYATINKTSIKLLYRNGSTANYITPTNVQVSNDRYSMTFSFQVNVKHTIGSTNYTCNYSTDSIAINYTKTVDFVHQGQSQIKDFNTTFSQTLFQKLPTCSQKVNSTDIKRIQEALSNTESSSVYLELKKILSKMPERMQENMQTQHLSHIYTENPYSYDFYHFIIDVNVSTVGTQQYGQSGVVNLIQGTAPESTHSASTIPEAEDGFNLYFAKEFIQNAIDFSVENLSKWKGIKANRTNIRSRAFRFRLIDYESIVPSILQKYPQKYMEDTEVSCDVVGYDNLVLNPDKNVVEVDFKWSCSVSLQISQKTRYTFLNFQPTVSYVVEITARNNNYLTVYEKPVKIIDVSFNIIDQHVVIEPFMAILAMEQGLFEFQTYTIGTFFKVSSSSSSQVKITENGFWVSQS